MSLKLLEIPGILLSMIFTVIAQKVQHMSTTYFNFKVKLNILIEN